MFRRRGLIAITVATTLLALLFVFAESKLADSNDDLATSQSTSRAVTVDRKPSRWTAPLVATGEQVLHGHVVDPAGRPIANATVTDAEGAFELHGLPKAEVALWADAPGLVGYLDVATEAAVIPLERGRVLKGVVSGSREKEVAGAFLTAIDIAHSRFFETTSTEGGHYELGPLPSKGRYRLVVMKPPLLPVALNVEPSDDPRDHSADLYDVTLSEPRAIAGTVERQFKPVASADVVLSTAHRSQRTRTDEAGHFRFEGLAPNTYELSAEQGNEGVRQHVSLSFEADEEDVVLDLAPTVTVRGRVTDGAVRPIPEAQIRADADGSPSVEATSSASGTFELHGLALHTWKVTAEAEGFLSATVEASASDRKEVELALLPAALIRGVVVDGKGAPVADAQLTASVVDEYVEGGTAVTEKDGRFTFKQLTAANYQLDVQARGYLPASIQATAPSKDVRITLDRGASVTGNVSESDGRPIADARVVAFEQLETETGEASEALTDSQGHFELTGVPGGKIRLNAALITTAADRKLTGQMISVTVNVPDHGHAEASIVFPVWKEISGSVVDESGAPLPGVRVEAKPYPNVAVPDRYASASELTDARGGFQLQSLFEGEYMLTALKSGYANAQLQAKTGADSVRMVMKPVSSIVGVVVTEDGGPLKGFKVDGRFEPEENGRFIVKGGGKMAFLMSLSADGYAPLEVPVPVFKGTYDLGALTLTRGRKLDGAVVNAVTGAPVENAVVEVLFADRGARNAPSSSQNTYTDHQGHFRFQRVDSRATALRVTKDGYMPTRSPLGASDGTVMLSLDPGASIHFRIFNARGEPSNGHLSYGTVDSKYDEERRVSEGVADVGGLAPGQYHFDYFPNFGAGHFRPIRLTLTAHQTGEREWHEATDGADVRIELIGGVLDDYRALLMEGAESASPPFSSRRFFGDWIMLQDEVFPRVPPGEWTLSLQKGVTGELARVVLKVTAEPTQTFRIPLPDHFEKPSPLTEETP